MHRNLYFIITYREAFVKHYVVILLKHGLNFYVYFILFLLFFDNNFYAWHWTGNLAGKDLAKPIGVLLSNNHPNLYPMFYTKNNLHR